MFTKEEKEIIKAYISCESSSGCVDCPFMNNHNKCLNVHTQTAEILKKLLDKEQNTTPTIADILTPTPKEKKRYKFTGDSFTKYIELDSREYTFFRWLLYEFLDTYCSNDLKDVDDETVYSCPYDNE